MIEEILPPATVAVELGDDTSDVTLSGAEATALGVAVERRRREFATGRACARRALEALGLPRQAVLVGPHGEPRWPPGVVGSITHCAGYRASVVARGSDLVTVGIDAEPNRPLPEGVLGDVASSHERARLRELSSMPSAVCWDRLLFSAKESVYKAWFPLTHRWLGFEDAVLRIDPHRGTFVADLLVSGPLVQGRRVTSFPGRWLACDGLVLTAVALPSGGLATRESPSTTTAATSAM